MIRIATPEDIKRIGELSVRLGNAPIYPEKAIVSFFEDDQGIAGFASVQAAWVATGSWVREDLRRNGHTYQLRNALDNELRQRGVKIYFALPENDFEKMLFAKYGTVTEHLAQMRHL